jgi:hypothetical protein
MATTNNFKRQRIEDAMTALDDVKEDLRDGPYMTIVTGLQDAYDEGDLHILTFLYIVPCEKVWRFIEGGPDQYCLVKLENEVRAIMCPLTESDLRAMKPNGVIDYAWNVDNLIRKRGVLLPSMTRKMFGDDDEVEIAPKLVLLNVEKY